MVGCLLEFAGAAEAVGCLGQGATVLDKGLGQRLRGADGDSEYGGDANDQL